MKVFRTIELESTDKDITNKQRETIRDLVEATLLNHMKKVQVQLRITNLPRRSERT